LIEADLRLDGMALEKGGQHGANQIDADHEDEVIAKAPAGRRVGL
jgi:hypothetical protein